MVRSKVLAKQNKKLWTLVGEETEPDWKLRLLYPVAHWAQVLQIWLYTTVSSYCHNTFTHSAALSSSDSQFTYLSNQICQFS